MTSETIAAIATAIGEAGIGIVRLSGSQALEIADQIFVTRHGILPSTLPGYSARYGRVVDPATQRTVDEAILLVSVSPFVHR